MTNKVQDKFNRDDGQLGSNWTVACGSASIFDEAIRPVDTSGSVNPTNPGSPIAGLTDERTQALYSGSTLDAAHQVLRCIWGHDDVTPEQVSGDPSVTLLARATKDPLLLDLGGSESPLCFDQAYGLRVTCPLNGDTPTLKLVKLTPDRRINAGPSSTAERDDATVLASVRLRRQDLHTDTATTPVTGDNKNDVTGVVYKGFWQDMRLRIRGTDGRVVIDAFLNDRYENNAILTFTDFQDPLWSDVGLPGIEFLSPVRDAQPAGASPFDQVAKSVMAVTLFSASTVSHLEQPRTVAPSSRYTYGKVVDRVITLVEKNGDAKYSATATGQVKRDTYLDFVMDAESEIIRAEGYFDWLKTEARIYLKDDVDELEMPEDFGELLQLRPGNWNGPPLQFFEPTVFRQYSQNQDAAKGKPRSFTNAPVSVNSRTAYKVFPIPDVSSIDTNGVEVNEDAFLVVEYYRRRLFPTEMDASLPVVPQADMDVLIYGGAAHAMILDTDPQNAQAMFGAYQGKLKGLRRKNNRHSAVTVMRSIADVAQPATQSRLPVLRTIQLEALL
ncbi:MAG: hypothetical protein V3S98_06285 [Dehalococcoidia bacterium]